MSVLSFISNRERGFLKNKKRNLNCNFLLEKFMCDSENTFSVRSSSGDCVPPYACQFRKDHCSGDLEILAVASEEGDITLINSSSLSKKKELCNWSAHQNAIFDICWLPDSPKLISAGGDHSVVLWDTVACKKITTFSSHTGSVKCINICQEQNSLFATGARDGTVKIWDTRIAAKNCCGLITKPDITISNFTEHKSKINNSSRGRWKCSTHLQTPRNVTCIAFQNANYLASGTCSETSIRIWDLRRTYCEKPKIHPNPKYILTYKDVPKNSHGSASMVFDSRYKKLYVCCTDDCIYALDCHSYSSDVVSTFQGFKAKTFFIKVALSVDDNYLLSGSSDEKAYIWNTSQPGTPLVSLSGHSAEVTSVAWHPYDVTTLATCGDDNRVLLWKTVNQELEFDKNAYSGLANAISKTNDSSAVHSENKVTSNVSISPRRPLKEITLTHFFSNINTSPSSNNTVKTQPTETVSNDLFRPCQENIVDRQLPILTNSILKSISKENCNNKISKSISPRSRHSQKKFKLKSHFMSTNSPVSKKRKINVNENLITSYFQDPL